MSWAATAVAAAAVVGGYMSSQGAQNAAQTQANAAANAQQISLQEFNTITGQEQPFMQSGYGAMNQLDYLLGIGTPQYSGTPQGGPAQGQAGFNSNQSAPLGGGEFMGPLGVLPSSIGMAGNPSITAAGPGTGFWAGRSTDSASGGGNFTPSGNFIPGNGQQFPFMGSAGGGFGSLLTPFTAQNWQQLSPAYNFQLQQGQQGVLGADASSMGALSGAAQKDLMSFNQGLANTSFNNAFNMYQTQQGNIYDRLAGVMQMGQAAAANTGQQGTALAGQAAQSATNIGTALGAGQVGAANAWSNTANTLGFMPWLTQGNNNPGSNNAWAGGGDNSAAAQNDWISSDRRLKTDIERIGETDSGLPIYKYRYKGGDTFYFGVMADEVIDKFPDAVIQGEDGYFKVNYGKIS